MGRRQLGGSAESARPEDFALGLANRTGELLSADWLICRAGTRRAALPLEHVREVMRALPLSPVADVPTFVLGVALIRGQAIPVVELARLLSGEAGDVARFVALRIGARSVALGVSEVVGTRRVDRNELGGVPPLLSQAGAPRTALAALDQRLLDVLEAGRLIDATFASDAEGRES